MKNIKRILFECSIIACVFGTVSFAFSLDDTKKTSEWINWTKGFPAAGKMLSKDAAKDLAAFWSEDYKKKYGAIGNVKYFVAYDKDTMELRTTGVPIEGIKYYDPKSFDLLAQFYSADSVVESNNNLAKRVRDIENRVQDIEKNCCP